MNQDRVERELRQWAGEPLWEGFPTVSRAVVVTGAGGQRFRAVGTADRKPAFEVLIRLKQLRRFRREMERAGAMVEGIPEEGGPGHGGERPHPHKGPINTDPKEETPSNPSQPKAFLPDARPPEPGPGARGPMLLLADPEEHRPVLPPDALGRDAVARIPRLEERLPRPEHLGDPGGNPNALAHQRWGVIAPKGSTGDALLESIRPLIDLRSEQQGSPVRVYRASPGGAAEANEWVRTTYHSESVPEDERPSYLLILGDLADVSAELQQRLSAGACVGRLCFDGPEGYRAYVDKVLRHEKAPPKQDARALFFTTHDGSEATVSGYDSLVHPALELCDAVPRRHYPVREVIEVGTPEDWAAPHLLKAARDGGPSVLFTLSHGLGPPRGGWSSPEQRRRLQGAMAFGKEAPLTAEGVARGPFLPGGAWFFLACLSAGTPSRSAYRPWLERLRASGEYGGRVEDVLAALPAAGEPPFIAALPRAALANPEGPLAIIGHLDLAWTYGFQDAYGARRPARFVEVVKQLWTGRRVGVAMKAFLRFASEAESELLSLAQGDAELEKGGAPPPEVVHRGHLWMARNDMAGYLLLGDPAVRVAPARD